MPYYLSLFHHQCIFQLLFKTNNKYDASQYINIYLSKKQESGSVPVVEGKNERIPFVPVIYCCLTKHPKSQWLKKQSFG